MKFILSGLLCFFPLIFLSQQLHAQKNQQNLITGTFHDQTIQEFTEEVERQTNYFFYYDISLFDSLHINLTANRDPLSYVMDQAFAKTDFKYSIGPHNEVFLTRGSFVQTNLTATAPDTAKGKRRVYVTVTEDGQNANQHLQVAALENKLYQIGVNSANNGQSTALISGYVRDAKTGEPVAGASIYIDKPRIGVASDQYGYYAISLPKGQAHPEYTEYWHEGYTQADPALR